MIILGLNDSNSAAAIIKDGILIAAAREERFSRIKFDDKFPIMATEYCLKEIGLKTIKDVDQIVFAWNPGHEIEPFDSSSPVRHHKHFMYYIPNNLLNLIKGDKKHRRLSYIEANLTFSDCKRMKIHFAPHHDCHAASCFLISPFEESSILTIDAYGEDITSKFFHGKRNKIKEIGRTLFPHSLGQVYAALTQYLGFHPNSDEWKVMGLAAYGNHKKYYSEFKKILDFDTDKGELRVNLEYFSYFVWHPRRYSDSFIEAFGPERYKDDKITDRQRDIAASFQKRVEDVILKMCRYLYVKTKNRNLCLAGGVAMNSKMNGRILEEGPFRRIWIQPSADDAGCSIGACFYYWNLILKKERCFRMEYDYWGPTYTDEQIEGLLKRFHLEYTYHKNIEQIVAQLIAKGNIIGWFQGRMEMGQRALGNRSILADPRDASMKDKINLAIKEREQYRPFAPSILEENKKEYFSIDSDNAFMQMVLPIRKSKHSVIPAVTHFDGTGRSQTVSKNINPRYWKLINEFRKITGIPILLNTSFNYRDEPIVCTPRDAIRCFYATGLTHLAIGNFLLSKNPVE